MSNVQKRFDEAWEIVSQTMSRHQMLTFYREITSRLEASIGRVWEHDRVRPIEHFMRDQMIYYNPRMRRIPNAVAGYCK